MSTTTATGAARASEITTLKVGSRVDTAKGLGTVRFLGAIQGSPKADWVGIELDLQQGNHDGTIAGVRYFRCPTNRGLFLTQRKVTLVPPKEVAAKPTAGGLRPIKSPASWRRGPATRRQQGAGPSRTDTAEVLANSLSRLGVTDVEESRVGVAEASRSSGWLDYSIARSCRAHGVHDENLRTVTFKHLMSYGTQQLKKLAGPNLYTWSVLERLQRNAEDYKFWVDALANTDTIFSLGENHHFVVTPQLINTLPSLAKDFLRGLDFEGPDNPTFAFKELFKALADPDFPSGPFSLPVLDLECRREALENLAHFIKRRHEGSAKGNGGSGRILLGPKGTGKSVFLQALAIASALLCPNLLVVYISYADLVHSASLPISPARMTYYADLCARGSTALGELPLSPPDDDWQVASTYLAGVPEQRRFLIIADEFNKVYSAKDQANIVAQFHSIGQATNCRVSPIISGSSAAMFDLCYGHINPTARAKYPSYHGVSLNSGRYTDLRMQPARGREQFVRMLQHISQAANSGHEKHRLFDERDLQKVVGALNDERQLKQLYALTGGRFRYIEELCLETKEDSSKSCLVDRILREFFDEWTSNPSFRAVMKKLVETKDTINMASAGLPEGEAAVDPFWAEAWVHFAELSDAQISEARLYTMGDDNLLFVESSKAGLRVTFEAGIQEDLCRAQMSKVSLAPYECVCLRYPYGQLGIDAESLVLTSLATNSQVLPKYEGNLRYAKRMFSMAPLLLRLAQGSRISTDDDFPREVLEDGISNEVQVWRFQIKLGQSVINEAKAKAIARKLKKGDKQVRNVLGQIPPGSLQPTFCHCLITTRHLDEKAQDHFATRNVLVLGREVMYNVWIEPIKEFDRSVRLGVYASLE